MIENGRITGSKSSNFAYGRTEIKIVSLEEFYPIFTIIIPHASMEKCVPCSCFFFMLQYTRRQGKRGRISSRNTPCDNRPRAQFHTRASRKACGSFPQKWRS